MILPKLVAIDLDGTLLDSRTHAISPFNMVQVQRVAALGHQVVLASGRAYHTIAAFALELGLADSTPLIAYNGALIRTLDDKTLQHAPLPAEASERIVHFCAAEGYHLNLYLNDQLYVREETKWSRLYQRRTGSVPQVTHDLTQFDGERPTKLLLIDEPDVTDQLREAFVKEYGDSLYITKTDVEYLEFMAPEVSKGRALARVAQELGIARADCIAFGDSFNDIPMLEWAGIGIAMGNAHSSAKEAASRVAPPAEDDGVGQLLRELFALP